MGELDAASELNYLQIILNLVLEDKPYKDELSLLPECIQNFIFETTWITKGCIQGKFIKEYIVSGGEKIRKEEGGKKKKKEGIKGLVDRYLIR